MGKKEVNAYRILVGKPEGGRPHGRVKWMDKTKQNSRIRSGVICLRTGTRGGVLGDRQ